MKIAIMQPYFMPYIGYWQLMNYADKFIIYDKIEYTKKGWINRNRILLNGSDALFTLPLKKGSDFESIHEKKLANNFHIEKQKIIRRIEGAYRKSPNYNDGMELVSRIFSYQTESLFEFIYKSIELTREYLGIDTELIISSSLPINEQLSSQERVIEICKTVKASEYINPIGGVNLYNEKDFLDSGVKLYFQKVGDVVYDQSCVNYVPNLSIIDVIMFNTTEQVKAYLFNMSVFRN
jgi:hypothetical protein